MGGLMTGSVNSLAENRRRQLRRWINDHFGGVQAEFIKSTNDGQTQMNQGELSRLLGNKSFGEKRARRLEQQAKMPMGYLDRPDEQQTLHMAAEADPNPSSHAYPTGWPFTRVTLQRLLLLRRGLGPQLGQDAIHDIDETLELAVQQWERRLTRKKNVAA